MASRMEMCGDGDEANDIRTTDPSQICALRFTSLNDGVLIESNEEVT